MSSQEPQMLVGGKYNATPPTLTDQQRAMLQMDADGALLVSVHDWIALANVLTEETGGTPVHYLSAASTNQTVVKASPGTLMNVTAINTTATVYYLKLHDTASTPTAGTTAVVQCYAIPASTSGNGFTISVPMTFASGIAFTLVGGIADNDTSNAATGITVDFVYR
jgi:hypothetical protein